MIPRKFKTDLTVAVYFQGQDFATQPGILAECISPVYSY